MKYLNKLDSNKCSLDGVYLIEASAGTGKTHNIQNLAIRLIVEKNLTIDQILIVTFTRMATAELTDRIRKILQSCSEYLEFRLLGNEDNKKDFSREHSLLENVLHDFSDKGKISAVRKKLQAALLDFDSNAISTIHGFCKKILEKNAFESGILFQTELTDGTESREKIMELIRNQWRSICYAPENRKYTGLYRGLLPFDQSFESKRESPCDEYLLHPEPTPFNRGKSAYAASYVPPGMEEFISLVEHPEIDFDFEETESPAILAEKLFSLTNDLREADAGWKIPATVPKQPPVSVELFLACPLEYGFGWSLLEKLIESADFGAWLPENESQLRFRDRIFELKEYMLRFRVRMLSIIRKNVTQQLSVLKQRENFQTFDDLQKRMLSALKTPGSILAETARTQFKAAIIDEFQDTDQVQYEIFTGIFAPGLPAGERRNGSLFFVGDPKQAIYAFRGGDIFTYKSAAEAVGKEHTLSLDKNFRSADALVAEVNGIFLSHNLPFADRSIEFEPVRSHNKKPLLFQGIPDAEPFHYLHGGSSKPAAYGFCAEKIFQILSSDVRRPEEKENGRIEYVPVSPSDIAILCRSRSGIDSLLKKLREKGIPCVINMDESIYDTQEARDLEKFLLAVQDPANIQAVTWLMQTSLAEDRNCRALCRPFPADSRGESQSAAAEVQEMLATLKNTFEQRGFSLMFQQFMDLFGIHRRYPGMNSGAQKYSNLLQLRDILAVQEKIENKSLGTFLLWLQKQLSKETRTDLESRVILATDAPAVRIMTIHASKGLQFPIVFLPDLASSEIKKERAEKYHNPQKNNKVYHRITYSSLSDLAVAESLQEELRIAYVAFTRAVCASYLLVPEKKSGVFNAVSWLFTAREIPVETLPEQLKAAYESLEKTTLAEGIGADRIETVECSGGVFSESFTGELKQLEWGDMLPPAPVPKISYSSAHKFFRRNKKHAGIDEEISGELGAGQLLRKEADLPDVFTLPRGDLFGTACHTILEKLDFQNPENLDFLIQRYLSVVNIGEHAGIAAQMFRNVIHSPIPAGDGSSFTLSEIPLSDRASEMDFDFKLNQKFDPVRIGRILNGFYRARLKEESLEKLLAIYDLPGEETFYTGSADLVFRYHGKYFIVDWKTDILEKTMESFAPEHLFGEMWQKFYLYQSLLYSSALIRFLALRLKKSPEAVYQEDFGGVRYLFLRGMDPAFPGRGVYADKPDFELICKIAEVE